MRNIYFDQDEMTLMAIFSAKTKRETVAVATFRRKKLHSFIYGGAKCAGMGV